jgi:hypothetical protein
MIIGIANSGAVGVQVLKEKSKKKFRRVFTILHKHKDHNNLRKKKKNSQSNLQHSTHLIRREVNRAARVIKNLPVNAKIQKLALRRLQRLHASTTVHVRGGSVKKEEEKKK